MDYPQAYPQRGTLLIRNVDKLWMVWTTFAKTAKYRHFSPWDMWISLWKLWMNAVFGCGKPGRIGLYKHSGTAKNDDSCNKLNIPGCIGIVYSRCMLHERGRCGIG